MAARRQSAARHPARKSGDGFRVGVDGGSERSLVVDDGDLGVSSIDVRLYSSLTRSIGDEEADLAQHKRSAAKFHNLAYAILLCSGILEMRHMSQLEMRQSSPLGMLVKRQRLEGRLAT